MADNTINSFGTWLRKAREKLKYTMITAARVTNFSSDALGRHERGEVMPNIEAALHYANKYNAPNLLMRYCNDCPINRKLRFEMSAVELPQNAIQFNMHLKKLEKSSKLLFKIASNGRVDEDERKQFKKVMSSMMTMDAITDAVKMYALENGLFDMLEAQEKTIANSRALAMAKIQF